jgi:hypothetical protein
MLRCFKIRRPRGFRSLYGCRRGATAVEFAICAPPFLLLMAGMFEVGWFYFANSIVDAATVNAARLIRTGVAQQNGFDKDEFFDAVCPLLSVLGDCDSRVTVEVKTYASFDELATDGAGAVCVDDNPEEVQNIAYSPGMDNEIVRVRICMMYSTMNPAIGINLTETEDGRRHLILSHVFRNEPFSRNQR